MASTSPQQLPGLAFGRALVDRLTKVAVGIGGIAVIAAIVLIMSYFVWVIIPMFAPASIKLLNSVELPTDEVIFATSDDRFEILTLIKNDGSVEFLDTTDYKTVSSPQVLSESIKQLKPLYPLADSFAIRTTSDELLFLKITHNVRFDRDERRIENTVELLFDETAIDVAGAVDFDVYRSETKLRVVTLQQDGDLLLEEYQDVDDYFELEDPRTLTIESWNRNPEELSVMLGPGGRWLYEFDESSGDYRLTNVASIRRFSVEDTGTFDDTTGDFVVVEPVLGRYSFLVANDQGVLDHWSLGPEADGQGLRKIRSFVYQDPIVQIVAEHRRKGFLAIDTLGTAHLGYTTSERKLAEQPMNAVPKSVNFSPRADRLITLQDDVVDVFKVSNKHPEAAWGTLWGRVAYEGYEKPVYSWQSSSADTDFEPKFSLAPLLFGSIKAAFYAMLVATPLAIMGAIYTAVFMSEGMRKIVKPGIEIMAALPTVILGFLAGLWLAPIVEKNLTAIMLLLVIPPIGVLICAYLTTFLPSRITARFEGWFGALTVPVILLLSWLTLAYGESLWQLIFGTNMRMWLENQGVEYDQRNALIIGIAMGFAVIPTIFSISEDAIYGVPRHLVHGSLALGATRWQTLVRVVLLTASPGIFSAVMIGMGRAVGETMIVLMATGNTPIMDINLFQGMRTFAANIAVEMPESEVGSTHFRILFLTALVLFVITFLFNTIAEIVRQRLRARYGNL
ncbi:MAG: ABC transporter permease subunit [Gammaproteobacteria bacterium]|nr:ABC transporter permease subunit [Gammaproteobacteria bacterium]